MINAASEGFNKIRHLIARAYLRSHGYRDYKYMKLKIYELPLMELTKRILSSYSK